MDNSNYEEEPDLTIVSEAPSPLPESAFMCPPSSSVPFSTIQRESSPDLDIPKRPNLKHSPSLKSSLSQHKDDISLASSNSSSSESKNSVSVQGHQSPMERGNQSFENQMRRSSIINARRPSQLKRRPSQLDVLPSYLEHDVESQVPKTLNNEIHRADSQIPGLHNKSEPSSEVGTASPKLQEKQDPHKEETDPGAEKDENLWGRRKISVHNMMDFSLMIANIAQLRALLTFEGNQFKYFILICIILSMTFQIIFACCMIRRQILNQEIRKSAIAEQNGQSKKFRRKRICKKFLDEIGNYLVLFILVSNGLITGFGFL